MSSRREILERVASGELTPDEAERLLREVEEQRQTSTEAVQRVRVSVGVGGIEVVGDQSIEGAEAEGPHRAELDGGTLVIHGDWDPETAGIGFVFGRRGRRFHVGRTRLDEGESATNLARLRIRMNPDLPLDCELDAGPVSVAGVHGPIRVRLAAGPVRIEGFSGPLDVSVNAGAVRATGRLTTGESRIRSDAGAVRVQLDPSSSVHIVAHAAIGKVVVLDGKRSVSSDGREATIGNGDATLRVETAMGSVHVSES